MARKASKGAETVDMYIDEDGNRVFIDEDGNEYTYGIGLKDVVIIGMTAYVGAKVASKAKRAFFNWLGR